MDLPNIFVPVEVLVGEDEPSNATPSIDHGADELPFNALGGRRFEVLGYLLELNGADEDVVVTLVQTASDKGRDLLVHHKGVLGRVIQCKNLLKKVGRPDLLAELVKLLLFNEVHSFFRSLNSGTKSGPHAASPTEAMHSSRNGRTGSKQMNCSRHFKRSPPPTRRWSTSDGKRLGMDWRSV